MKSLMSTTQGPSGSWPGLDAGPAPRVLDVLRLLFSTAAVVTAPFLPVGVSMAKWWSPLVAN